MGSPTLKAKVEHNYKKYPANSERLCLTCNHYVADAFSAYKDGVRVRHEARCTVFRLKSGRAYRVLWDHGCDAHDNSEYMAKCERGTR